MSSDQSSDSLIDGMLKKARLIRSKAEIFIEQLLNQKARRLNQREQSIHQREEHLRAIENPPLQLDEQVKRNKSIKLGT
jgi:hypothetical protein